ncbi:MAG: response regulator [Deltaproteobacteria bacterium]|nr:response regulator [Deltaproteobacteria bacterium]
MEDEPATIDVVQQQLEFLGYEVTVAKDGLEAVEMATSELPDLIVIDIRMPKMDGLQAASQIRANPKTKMIPMLAATAKALPEDRQKCLASGCDDYIAKPFTHRELGAFIVSLLTRKARAEQPAAQTGEKRILIIDDNADFSNLVRSRLEETGKYKVQVENEGSSGIDTARTFKPDLILLDVVMPDIGGPEVAEQLRDDKEMARIPVVFLTSIVSEEEVKSHGGLIGGRHFIAKTERIQNIVRHLSAGLTTGS